MGEAPSGISTSDFVKIGNEGRVWVDRDKSTSTADFYSWMVDCRRLLLSRGELTWLEKHTVPDRKVDVFVNMSCGTQLIPHVTLEIVDVLRALGVSFVAGTGPQYCCGKPFRTRDLVGAGEKVTQSSIDRFLGWGATTATHVCQSCQIIYSNHAAERDEADVQLANVHFAAFLANRLDELGDAAPWAASVDQRFLVADCHSITPVHKESHENVERIIEMIPGATVAGRIHTTSRGAPCTTDSPGGPSILAELTPEECAEVTRDMEQQARDAGGADAIVMHAHWCQREWQKFSSDSLSVNHFVSVLAQALGCSHPNRYEEFWKLRDPDAVVEAARPNWESWGMSEEAARTVAYKNFDPHYSGFLNPDCACGGDPRRCNTGRNTLLDDR